MMLGSRAERHGLGSKMSRNDNDNGLILLHPTSPKEKLIEIFPRKKWTPRDDAGLPRRTTCAWRQDEQK